MSERNQHPSMAEAQKKVKYYYFSLLKPILYYLVPNVKEIMEKYCIDYFDSLLIFIFSSTIIIIIWIFFLIYIFTES